MRSDRSAKWHNVPDFVIELKSGSDRIETLRRKMEECIANGVSLGWLIIPETRTIEIYRTGQRTPEAVKDAHEIHGDDVLNGFVLQLDEIWRAD